MPASKNKARNSERAVTFIKQHKISTVISVIFLILILLDLTPFGGNIRFYSRWIACGQKPVATAGSGFLNGGAQHYYEPSSFPGLHSTIEYFCTPLEAERAGYSANPDSYDFPHLHQMR